MEPVVNRPESHENRLGDKLRPRRAYLPPKLSCLGDVHTITQAVGATSLTSDGGTHAGHTKTS